MDLSLNSHIHILVIHIPVVVDRLSDHILFILFDSIKTETSSPTPLFLEAMLWFYLLFLVKHLHIVSSQLLDGVHPIPVVTSM